MALAEREINSNGTALVVREGGDITPMQHEGFLTNDKIDLLKRTICEGATNDELELFVAQCRRTGLDPFVRQIHAVKRWNAQAKREVMTIQVGIDGLRLIAERTGNYAPGQDAEFAYAKDNTLHKATAFVKKWVHGEWHSVPASALWTEYCQVTREGKPMAMWGKMPHVMLEKVAEARALRKAFPQETSGLYIHEEMMQAESEPQAPPRPAPTRAQIEAPAPESSQDALKRKRAEKVAATVDRLAGLDAEKRTGWLDRFEQKYGIRNIKMLSFEQLDESGFAVLNNEWPHEAEFQAARQAAAEAAPDKPEDHEPDPFVETLVDVPTGAKGHGDS